MRLLAIDPGNEQSAYVLYVNGKPAYFGKIPNADLCEEIVDGCNSYTMADALAIEMIASYGMAVGKEVFDTCVWIGRFAQAWYGRMGESPRLVYRKDVKLFHCGTNRANDANIRAALIDRYGPGKEKAIGTKKSPGPLYGIKGDEWSALAIAVMVSERLTMR